MLTVSSHARLRHAASACSPSAHSSTDAPLRKRWINSSSTLLAAMFILTHSFCSTDSRGHVSGARAAQTGWNFSPEDMFPEQFWKESPVLVLGNNPRCIFQHERAFRTKGFSASQQHDKLYYHRHYYYYYFALLKARKCGIEAGDGAAVYNC